jgi:hypothetical protein
MKVTLRASTGARVVVWRERDSFCARRAAEAVEPEICLAVDLFEVLADLAGLDLERDDHAAEALRLSEEAQRHLAPPAGEVDGHAERAGDLPDGSKSPVTDPRRRSGE